MTAKKPRKKTSDRKDKKQDFTDIQNRTFWDLIIPGAYRPLIRMARLDRPIGIWLLLLPCWMSVLFFMQDDRIEALWLGGLFALGAIVMRSAGCVINDLWDRRIDGAVERTRQRPLPSGQVTIRQALTFLLALLLCGLVILLQMNVLTIMLGFASMILVIAYPLMKRITYWPQLFLGLTFNWGMLLGATASLGFLPEQALWLYVACIFWTLSYDTIYAFQDIEDDRMIGVKSTALLFEKHPKSFVGSCMVLCIVFLALGGLFWFALLPAIHFAWQLQSWDPKSQENSLLRFKSNRDAGFVMMAAILLERLV